MDAAGGEDADVTNRPDSTVDGLPVKVRAATMSPLALPRRTAGVSTYV
jgi:hypothetical protein